MNLKLKNLRTPAALTAAAAIAVLTQGAASASTTHHPAPAVISSYTCTPYISGWGDGRALYGESCSVQVAFTGPQGEWKLSIRTPRREELVNFTSGTTESSALGGGAPQTKYAPMTLTGCADIYAPEGPVNPATCVLPAGKTATGLFAFDVPAGERVPTVTIQAAS